MVSNDTREEIEQYLGTVPSWIDALAPAAADQSWALVRDLEFGETVLSDREKELVGLGAAAAMQCEYCTHFHGAGAKLAGVSEEERNEAVNVAGNARYFSTILHGAQVDYDAFVEETDEIMAHVREQGAQAAGAD